MQNDKNESEKRVHRVVMKCGYTDLRCGIRTLRMMLELLYGVEMEEGTTYAFCGRSAKLIKELKKDKGGHTLTIRLLEESKVKWIRNSEELVEITPEEYEKILQGVGNGRSR